MSNKIFTEKEIEILSKNEYVENVSAKGIIYTNEFRRIFVAENAKGKLPLEIFKEYGFDINILGKDRIKSSGKRWRAAFRQEGISGLNDRRKENSGRPGDKELSIEEKYERLKVQNNYLKAENELLKKIDFMERGMRTKS